MNVYENSLKGCEMNPIPLRPIIYAWLQGTVLSITSTQSFILDDCTEIIKIKVVNKLTIVNPPVGI